MSDPAEPLQTPLEICEALARHVEIRGYDIFEKHFVRDGKVVCTIWCVMGSEAECFARTAHAWLDRHGFKEGPQ